MFLIYIRETLPLGADPVRLGDFIHADGSAIDGAAVIQCTTCHRNLTYGEYAAILGNRAAWVVVPPPTFGDVIAAKATYPTKLSASALD